MLKGVPSNFALELPPYRLPQVGRVLMRSVLDRTLFVLGRAVTVAAPAGLILWVLAHLQWHGVSLLAHAAAFLQPLGHLMGLDGTILIAFLLGLPANEIVLPIILMADRQSTGGYPKIATIISADFGRFAQTRPRHTLRFAAIDVAAAQQETRAFHALLQSLPARIHNV